MTLGSVNCQPFSTIDRIGPISKGFATGKKKRDLYVPTPGTPQNSMSERRPILPKVVRLNAPIADSRPTTNHQIAIVIRLLKPQ